MNFSSGLPNADCFLLGNKYHTEWTHDVVDRECILYGDGIPLKPLVNIVVDRFKKLYNWAAWAVKLCSDGWKNIQECKNNESHTLTMKISMKTVFIVVNDNNSSTVVNGGDILGFHFFEALNDNLEAYFFHRSIFTPHQIFW